MMLARSCAERSWSRLLRDSEDEKRQSVSGSIVEYGRADTLGVSQACCAARMP